MTSIPHVFAPDVPAKELEKTLYRLDSIRASLRAEYIKSDDAPWIIAFSGGKDSTLLLQLVWEAISDVSHAARQRKVIVVGNDTLVESPLVIEHLKHSLNAIRLTANERDLPITAKITKPSTDQTFWVNVIGRGYIPPTRNFRWCTDRMKILPTNKLIEKLIRIYGSATLLIGTRKAESETRRRNMERHGATATEPNPHSSIDDCAVFTPLADMSTNEVWITLMQCPPPWGGTHANLISLYRNAGNDECPLVLSKEDAPSCGSTSPRFGCWTCTVVKKDKSLMGIIESGHRQASSFERLFEFREWLIELRENPANRMRARRDGTFKNKRNGSPVLGPFSIDVRKCILQRLTSLEEQIGRKLLSSTEMEIIKEIWGRDSVRQSCRSALHQAIRLNDEEVAA